MTYSCFFCSMRWTTEVLMHMSPQECISILRLQIHSQIQLFHLQLVYMGKQQLDLLLDPASVTSQRIQYSLMPYRARCAGVSRTIIWLKVLAMEAGTQNQTQQGQIGRPTLQAPMTLQWTWFQIALGMNSTSDLW